MPKGICPECDSNVKIPSNPKVGQKVTCRVCRERLEVLYTDPLELTYAEDDYASVEEDYYDHGENRRNHRDPRR